MAIKLRLERAMDTAKIQTFKELYEKSGVHYNTILNLRDGKGWKTLDKLCVTLGVQPGDILEFVEDSE